MRNRRDRDFWKVWTDCRTQVWDRIETGDNLGIIGSRIVFVPAHYPVRFESTIVHKILHDPDDEFEEGMK